MTTVFRGGWVPTPPERPRVRLTASLVTGKAPPAVNYGSALWPTIGMHLNDQWGCCVLSASANIIEQQTYFGSHWEVVIPDSAVLAAYEAVGQFNPAAGPPGNNPTDNGAVIADGLDYLKKTGMSGRKIAAYGQVSTTSHLHLQTAVWEFGGLSAGLSLPNSAIAQFDAGRPWSVTKDRSPAGGHCVYVCGYDTNGYLLWTWGKLWHMSYAFWAAFGSEAWAPITTYWVDKASGKDPAGVNLVTLGEEFLAITGQNPFPSPPPPVPPATASASVTPPQPAPAPAPVPQTPTVPSPVVPALAPEHVSIWARLVRWYRQSSYERQQS